MSNLLPKKISAHLTRCVEHRFFALTMFFLASSLFFPSPSRADEARDARLRELERPLTLSSSRADTATIKKGALASDCFGGNGPICLALEEGCIVESVQTFCEACEVVRESVQEGRTKSCSKKTGYALVKSLFPNHAGTCDGKSVGDCRCEGSSTDSKKGCFPVASHVVKGFASPRDPENRVKKSPRDPSPRERTRSRGEVVHEPRLPDDGGTSVEALRRAATEAYDKEQAEGMVIRDVNAEPAPTVEDTGLPSTPPPPPPPAPSTEPWTPDGQVPGAAQTDDQQSAMPPPPPPPPPTTYEEPGAMGADMPASPDAPEPDMDIPPPPEAAAPGQQQPEPEDGGHGEVEPPSGGDVGPVGQ